MEYDLTPELEKRYTRIVAAILASVAPGAWITVKNEDFEDDRLELVRRENFPLDATEFMARRREA